MLRVNIEDAALIRPEDNNRNVWFRFWRKIFGHPVPVSGDRAHIGHMLITYRPGGGIEQFTESRMGTDAARVHSIGDLLIFDYQAEPRTVETFENTYFSKLDAETHANMPAFDHELLKENIKDAS